MSKPVIESRDAKYLQDFIEATYDYKSAEVTENDGSIYVKQSSQRVEFRTIRRVPKVGLMMIGIGGNNGTTLVAGILANKKKITWRSRTGVKRANWLGSLMLAGTVKLGMDTTTGEDFFCPLSSLLPLLNPDDLEVSGWDLNKMPLGEAMERAEVFDIGIQDQLFDELQQIKPLPAVYFPSFIASNQEERADNILSGSPQEQMERIRQDIREFKASRELDKVIVLWTGTTERFVNVTSGVHDTADNLLNAIEGGYPEISPSTIYAAASILENCAYINGSPQNTFVPGVIDLAERRSVFIAGDDFKSGQTKLKSVLVDFLVSAGIKPKSIVSYNHLGNNDGRNLSSPPQFRSKEISKSTVVDDMVASNQILFPTKEDKPDHCVVIKYVPFVGDSKRAMDEYLSEIFMGGLSTIAIHNTCEDSLLAAPIMLDLVLLMELSQRIQMRLPELGQTSYEQFHPILSLLSYLCKAPMVPPGTPVVNSLTTQRACIVNVLKACIGLAPDSQMMLEHKIPTLMAKVNKGKTNRLLLTDFTPSTSTSDPEAN